MENDNIREATKKIRLIDVNDALERLRKVEPKLQVVDFLGIKVVDIDAFIRFLESRKTVDAVEVVHGRWNRKQLGKYTGIDEVVCSCCGYFVAVVSTDIGFNEAIKDMNYCPNCGAKMDGDKYE